MLGHPSQSRRQVLGGMEPRTVVSMANLGALLFERGSLGEAGTLLHEALHVRLSTLGALDPLTLRSLDAMGRVHRAKGEHDAAVATATQALDGRRKVLGHYHMDTLKAMLHLAAALYDRAMRAPLEARKLDVAKALRLYRDALDQCRATLGDRHALTIQAMNNLGNLLHARGLLMPKFIAGRGPNRKRDETLAEGAELLREALAACQAKHGRTHLESLIGASNLGSALRSLGGDRVARPGYTADELASIEHEASGLIREAVAGIAEQCKEPPIETQPRARADLLEGLAELDEGREALEELAPRA
jgi:tetratricopeptide (TPR) repeat protein